MNIAGLDLGIIILYFITNRHPIDRSCDFSRHRQH